MTPAAYIDFETRSVVDLKKAGVETYSMHPSTEVLCMAYAIGDEAVRVWHLQKGPLLFPADLAEHVASRRRVVAHHAHFELNIWAMMHRRFPADWPELPAEIVDDTMARARTLGLPGGLGDCAHALRVPVAKDKEGHALMLQMCKPKKTRDGLVWIDTPAKRQRLAEYCAVDVEVERQLDRILPPLTESERRLWLHDWTVNQRGVMLDVPSARRADALIGVETLSLNWAIGQLTGGKVPTANARAKLMAWLAENGADLDDLRKGTVADTLRDERDALPAAAVQGLELRQEAAKASTAKLKAMISGAGPDSRARGLLAFYGAGTGRYAGRRIQTQNMPRTPKGWTVKDAELVFGLLATGEDIRDFLRFEYGSTMQAISNCLRSLIVAPPGARLIARDYSNIEGRVLAWIAGEEWKLKAFREFDAGTGPDLYKLAYSKSFGIGVDDVTDDQRQIGKVQELALGYQGGKGAFANMAANYGITVVVKRELAPKGAKMVLTEDEVEDIKDGWRGAHPRVKDLWYGLEKAAVAAIQHHGEVFSHGPIKYRMMGDFLTCKLPSGRLLWYAYAALKPEAILYRVDPKTGVRRQVFSGTMAVAHKYHRDVLDGPHAIEWTGRERIQCYGVDQGRFAPYNPYGGLFTENVVQAVARDILADAMLRLEAAGYPVVMHVHDEAVCELPEGVGSGDEMTRVMCELPAWAEGLPVAASGWEGTRYRK